MLEAVPPVPAYIVALATAALMGAKAVLMVRANGNGNGYKNGSEVSAAEWRGKVVTILEGQSKTLDTIADSQKEVVHILGELERRGRGGEEAIRKILSRDT